MRSTGSITTSSNGRPDVGPVTYLQRMSTANRTRPGMRRWSGGGNRAFAKPCPKCGDTRLVCAGGPCLTCDEREREAKRQARPPR